MLIRELCVEVGEESRENDKITSIVIVFRKWREHSAIYSIPSRIRGSPFAAPHTRSQSFFSQFRQFREFLKQFFSIETLTFTLTGR